MERTLHDPIKGSSLMGTSSLMPIFLHLTDGATQVVKRAVERPGQYVALPPLTS